MSGSADTTERKSFVLDRMTARSPALIGEMMWASGKTTLPGESRPPEWVKLAIQRMSRATPLQLESISCPTDVTPKVRGTMSGMAAAGSLSILSPTESEMAQEEKNLHLKAFRDLFKSIGEEIRMAESELTKTQPELGAPKSPKEVEDYHEGGRRGAEFVSEEAEMSMKAELCFWLWILWPDVRAIGSRVKVHEWFAEMRFVSCSFKLFENVCQEIGFRPSE